MSTFAFVGPPGSGKSTMIASACKAGYKVLLADIDCKFQHMVHTQPFIDSGQIELWQPKSRLVEDSLVDRAKGILTYPKKMPNGYIEIVEFINSLYDDQHGADIFALDSVTKVSAHLKRYMLHMIKKHHFEIVHWDSWLSQLVELTDSVLQLPFEHVILTYHDKITRDETTGKIHRPVAIDGQYSNLVGQYFTEMYAMEIENQKGKDPVYKIRTVGDDRREARTSYKLGTEAPADLSKILPAKSKEKGGE